MISSLIMPIRLGAPAHFSPAKSLGELDSCKQVSSHLFYCIPTDLHCRDGVDGPEMLQDVIRRKL